MSLPPSSGTIKPNPLALLNHLTLPINFPPYFRRNPHRFILESDGRTNPETLSTVDRPISGNQALNTLSSTNSTGKNPEILEYLFSATVFGCEADITILRFAGNRYYFQYSRLKNSHRDGTVPAPRFRARSEATESIPASEPVSGPPQFSKG